METKYIFVTGGVVSSLGNGIIASSLACLLKARGFRVTIQKFDPYINIDPGTLNPYEHGECYVTVDGHEADLDLSLLYVDLDAEFLPPFRKPIETLAVECYKPYGNDVAVVLDGFLHECLLPFQVVHLPSGMESRYKTGRENDYLPIGGIFRIDSLGCCACLASILVDRKKHGVERLYIHQKVVDKKADVLISVALTQYRYKGDAVEAAERMIGREHHAAVFGREILGSLDCNFNVKVLQDFP